MTRNRQDRFVPRDDQYTRDDRTSHRDDKKIRARWEKKTQIFETLGMLSKTKNGEAGI